MFKLNRGLSLKWNNSLSKGSPLSSSLKVLSQSLRPLPLPVRIPGPLSGILKANFSDNLSPSNQHISGPVLYSTDTIIQGLGKSSSVSMSNPEFHILVTSPPGLGGNGLTESGAHGSNPEQLMGAALVTCFRASIIHVNKFEKLLNLVDYSCSCTVSARRDSNKLLHFSFHLYHKFKIPPPVPLAASSPSVDQNQNAEILVHRAHQVCPVSRSIRGSVSVTDRIEVEEAS